jgi:hypothetical protein
VPGDATEMDVTGLEPGKKYEFRVKAKNDEGESDPLDGENAIVAKDPFGELLISPNTAWFGRFMHIPYMLPKDHL